MARLDFANARLGARRAQLLGVSGLRELLARATLEAQVELLRARRVGAAVPAVLGPDPLAEVERALRETWRIEAARLLEDVETARPRRLIAAYLALDEAQAVKAVLRGVAQGAPPDRTLAAAPPVPGLGEEALRLAASAPGLEAAVAALEAAGSTLVARVREALPPSPDLGLLPAEVAVDRAVLARARAACRRRGEDELLLHRHLEDRADVRNAMTLLALAGAPPALDLRVAGGRRLDEPAFHGLCGAPAAEVRAALARAFPGTEAALSAPWAAERALERTLVAPLRREARRRPLSIAVPLAYLAERRAEVRCVALVLRGAALGLPGEEILDLAEG